MIWNGPDKALTPKSYGSWETVGAWDTRKTDLEKEEERFIQSTALQPFHSSQISNSRRNGARKIILS